MYGATVIEDYHKKNNKYPEGIEELKEQFSQETNIDRFHYEKFADGQFRLSRKIDGVYSYFQYDSDTKKIELD